MCPLRTYSLTWSSLDWGWEGLGAGGEGDDRGWDGCMASPTQWTWVWVYCGSWWWTGRPGVLRFMGLQRVRHNWATDLSWTETGAECPATSLSVPKPRSTLLLFEVFSPSPFWPSPGAMAHQLAPSRHLPSAGRAGCPSYCPSPDEYTSHSGSLISHR